MDAKRSSASQLLEFWPSRSPAGARNRVGLVDVHGRFGVLLGKMRDCKPAVFRVWRSRCGEHPWFATFDRPHSLCVKKPVERLFHLRPRGFIGSDSRQVFMGIIEPAGEREEIEQEAPRGGITWVRGDGRLLERDRIREPALGERLVWSHFFFGSSFFGSSFFSSFFSQPRSTTVGHRPSC